MLTLQLSPLQLEGYYVREFHFVMRPGLEEQEQVAMQVGLHMQLDGLFNPDPISINMLAGGGRNQEDPFRWVAVLELSTNNAPEVRFPYDFRAVLVGYFKLNHPESAEMTVELERALKVNSTTILYSAARELIANVTGRGLFPAAVLPSVVIRHDAGSKGKQLPATKKAQAVHKSTAKKAGRKGKK
jgi:preprotein translocase subunit SecB